MPSDADRSLVCPLNFDGVVLTGLNLMLEGEPSNESVSAGGVGPSALCSSQYSSRTCVLDVSIISSLSTKSQSYSID